MKPYGQKAGRPVRVGLYGIAGHQITDALENHPLAELVAVAGFPEGAIPPWFANRNVRILGGLDELLAADDVDLVSFCSPRKDKQGNLIIRCLEAGKHAYAEKPCCMNEETLDRILAVAARTGKIFHEMAGTAFGEPFASIREMVASGSIGEVIQLHVQKSYPWADWRPDDEGVDGGLALQVGVHATRLAEHVAGVRLKSLELRETKLGNDKPGSECRRAVSFQMGFVNGGIGSAVLNYCCPDPPSLPCWGYDSLIIFGTQGFIETTDFGRSARIVLNGCMPEALEIRNGRMSHLDMFLEEVRTGRRVIPFTAEEETNPTRWAIRAKSGS